MISFFRPREDFVGWFGKLPAVGDFAVRGLPRPLRETIHDWFAQGMADLCAARPDDWREAYLVAPVWHFAVNAGVWDRSALAGCLVPSIDRIGRCSPLLALRSFDKTRIVDVLPPRSPALYRVDALLRRVIRDRLAVEDVLPELQDALAGGEGERSEDEAATAGSILAELGIVDGAGRRESWLSWPDLAVLFAQRSNRSFWWSEPSPKQPPRQVVHSGAPDSELFALLLGRGEAAE